MSLPNTSPICSQVSLSRSLGLWESPSAVFLRKTEQCLAKVSTISPLPPDSMWEPHPSRTRLRSVTASITSFILSPLPCSTGTPSFSNLNAWLSVVSALVPVNFGTPFREYTGYPPYRIPILFHIDRLSDRLATPLMTTYLIAPVHLATVSPAPTIITKADAHQLKMSFPVQSRKTMFNSPAATSAHG